jgi:hypothetical protein
MPVATRATVWTARSTLSRQNLPSDWKQRSPLTATLAPSRVERHVFRETLRRLRRPDVSRFTWSSGPPPGRHRHQCRPYPPPTAGPSRAQPLFSYYDIKVDEHPSTDTPATGADVGEPVKRRGQRGRPRLGSAPASVESVRLEPELRGELAARAASEGVSSSELIRRALWAYLRAG